MKYKHGFPNYSQTEVMHYGWYYEPGIYYYQAQGTGIYLNLGETLIASNLGETLIASNLGETLIASNKVDALKKLGLTNLEVLSISNHYVLPYPTVPIARLKL